jgi:pyruvate dehydrogenase phosphatase
MLEPAKVPSKTTTVIRHPKEPTMTATEIQANTSLASHPNKEAKIPSRPKEIKLAGLSLREGFPPRSEDVTEEEKKSQEQNSGTPTSATFGRFASKMKLMLRRKNTNAKKKQKKKEYEDVERIEDVHWTEM